MDASGDSSAFSASAPMATDPPAPASSATGGDASAPEMTRSALQTTLSVASSAANLVLFPYVVAGRAAYQATSFAVTAPIKVTKHVANSLSESWQQQTAVVEPSQQQPPVDLFGERELESSRGTVSAATTDSDLATSSDDDDAPVVEGVLFEAEAPVEDESIESETTTAVDATATSSSAPGVVSQLIFLPVRFVSSSVSTAAALPASAISLGGRTISGAVSTSQSLASSALVASGGLALRTTRHVASGITQGAFSTAHRVTGLVGSSVRTASYVIPPSVSNALWHGMERTGSMSTRVISYAIAVPTYRMAQALVPQVEELFTEQQLVDTTKDGVKLLVKLLGPQNAFYVLKFMYETVNSEEVYDAFLLVQDIVRESLDAENYKKAGSSVSEATGIEALKPVVKSVYDMMPSLDELVDAALFVGEIADEIMSQVVTVPTNDDAEISDTGRFELLSSEGEEEREDVDSLKYVSDEDTEGRMMSPIADDEAFSSESAIVLEETFEILGEANEPADVENAAVVEIDEDAFAGSVVDEAEESDEAVDEPVGAVDAEAFGSSFGSSKDDTSSSHAGEDALAELFNSSVSFFSSVLDSNEASMLLNTFGDFIDVLVE